MFDDGNVRSEGQYVNGKKVGPWRFYYSSGKIMEEGNFKEDKPIGLWRWYYESGHTQREEFYKNGLEDGDIREFLDSSKQIVMVQVSYSNGKREGEWTYTIGESKISGKYADDVEEGIWRDFYPDGVTHFEGKYHDGLENGSHKYYYPNGFIKEDRFYRSGQREKREVL